MTDAELTRQKVDNGEEDPLTPSRAGSPGQSWTTSWRKHWNTRSTTSTGSCISTTCRASMCSRRSAKKRPVAVDSAAWTGMVTVSQDIDFRWTSVSAGSLPDSRSCSSRGVAAYATGGFIRDVLRANPVKDLDVSIDADPSSLAPEITDAFGGSFFVMDELIGGSSVCVAA